MHADTSEAPPQYLELQPNVAERGLFAWTENREGRGAEQAPGRLSGRQWLHRRGKALAITELHWLLPTDTSRSAPNLPRVQLSRRGCNYLPGHYLPMQPRSAKPEPFSALLRAVLSRPGPWQARGKKGAPLPPFLNLAPLWQLRKVHVDVFREQLGGLSRADSPAGSSLSCPPRKGTAALPRSCPSSPC